MGCIEIKVDRVCQTGEERINRNMGCIEIPAEKQHAEGRQD